MPIITVEIVASDIREFVSFDFDFLINDGRIAARFVQIELGPKGVGRNTRPREIRVCSLKHTYAYIRGDISDEAKYLRENFAVGGAAS